ncbi:MAG: hypothetical protein GXP25_00030 [Planctomycetes bacterium]|nr:hypothetical protein [Planctomycetota bacterium]
MRRSLTLAALLAAALAVGGLSGQEVRHAGQRAGRWRPRVAIKTLGPGLAVRQSGPIVYPWQINVVDRAHFNAAALLLQKGEPAEAIDEMKQIVANSPDEDAVPAAHLSIGNLLRESLSDPDGAVTEYKNVTGSLAFYAAEAIAKVFRDKKQPAQGAALIEELIPKARGIQPIALLLVTLSKLYDAAGDRAKAIQTLRRGRQLIPDNNDALFRLVSGKQIRKTLDEMARQKEAGKDAEADDLVEDIKTPWRRRARERREQ